MFRQQPLACGVKSMNSLKVLASGKINLVLSVLGVRDDGYHELDSIMQSVGIYDSIKITKAEKIEVICGEWGGEKNICFKAAKSFFEFTKISAGAIIEIEKNIPSPAGLGGGSADAAAVLVALDKIYETNLSLETLISLAKGIGADVPFLIEGGTKRARGIGEKLESLKSLPDCAILIAKNGQKPSTGEMFKRLDSMDYIKPDTKASAEYLNSGDMEKFLKSLGNSFSALYEKSELEEKLKETKPLAVSLSGSGPSFFAVYKTEEEAALAAKQLGETETFICHPTEKSLIFE